MSETTDLFNNPMFDAAMKAMSPEDIESYKKIGEKMYKNMENMSKETANLPSSMKEATAYVVTGLNSGLHPKDMDANEVILLTNTIGPKWYEDFGYKKEDLPDISIKL